MRCWVALRCVVLAALVGASPTTQSVPAHLLAARELVANLRPENNDYQHKDCLIQWKESGTQQGYANRSDCSDFLNLLMEHAYHVTPEQLKELTGIDGPPRRIGTTHLRARTAVEKD